MTTLPPITEAELQRLVTDAASALGWQWLHVRPGRTLSGWITPTSGPLGQGWPDLTMVQGSRPPRPALGIEEREGRRLSGPGELSRAAPSRWPRRARGPTPRR